MGLVDQNFIREERFSKVLSVLGVKNFSYSPELGEEYLFHCPRKTNLMPHTLETLDYLKSRYPMTIITNGFNEIQELKLTSSGIHEYFDLVITSGHTGYLKPHRSIFDFAIRHADACCSECIMIGDNPITDISGAKDAGIDQIYYNSRACLDQIEPTYKIGSLQELTMLL
jgi:putative hydrolase of the HAD superfamily